MPICTQMGEPEWPADRRCRRRSGETTRCEPPTEKVAYTAFAPTRRRCSVPIPRTRRIPTPPRVKALFDPRQVGLSLSGYFKY